MSEYVTREREIYAAGDLGCGIKLERVHEHVTVKLKACPHCCGMGRTVHVDTSEGDMVAMKCEKCGVSTRECESHEEAAELWNARRVNLVSKKSALKNCAFCGGKADVIAADGLDEENEGKERIECMKCGAHTEYYADIKDGVKVWGRRAG